MRTEVGNSTTNPAVWDIRMVVHVDFGDALDPVLLPTLDVVGLAVSTPVVMRDHEGNACRGVVSRIDDRLAWIQPDWDSWEPNESLG